MGLAKNTAITATLAVYLLGSAGCSYAAESKVVQASNPIRQERALQASYETVDDILGDSFEAISSHNYDEKIQGGKSIVMFYTSDDVEGYCGRLAQVFSKVVPEFDGEIQFYKFEDDSDPELAKNGHVGLRTEYGVKGIPHTIFYEEGNKVYEIDGAPHEGFTEEWVPWMKEKINKYLK